MSSINLNEELNCSTHEVYLLSITLNALYSEKIVCIAVPEAAAAVVVVEGVSNPTLLTAAVKYEWRGKL